MTRYFTTPFITDSPGTSTGEGALVAHLRTLADAVDSGEHDECGDCRTAAGSEVRVLLRLSFYPSYLCGLAKAAMRTGIL